MDGQRFRFRSRVTAVAVGTLDELTYTPPDAEAFYVVTRWAVENATHASTSVRSVVRGSSGYDHPLNEQKTPAAGTLYWDTEETFLNPGQTLVASFVGATAADALALYVEGYSRPLGDGDE